MELTVMFLIWWAPSSSTTCTIVLERNFFQSFQSSRFDQVHIIGGRNTDLETLSNEPGSDNFRTLSLMPVRVQVTTSSKECQYFAHSGCKRKRN